MKLFNAQMNKLILLVLLAAGFPASGFAKDVLDGFPSPQTDFQAHIAEVETYLLSTQMQQRTASDVQYNLPFSLEAKSDVAYRGRFLLIHGLNDSPYVYTDVAVQLSERGFDVRAVLLPGHGNTPKAQLHVSHHQWLGAAREHLNLWNKDKDSPIFLGGFSMGAVIATILALENENIAGLLLFSPAYKSTQNHLLRWASIYSKFKPWVFGGMIIEDNPTKYNSIPINSAAQYYNLTKLLRRKWGSKKLAMPVLAIASIDDSVIDIAFSTKVFNRRFSSTKKRLLIYSNATNTIDTPTVEYRKSIYPEQRVINQSHQGVLIAPQNPLFGRHGSVLVCNGNDWPTFSACLYSTEEHWRGANKTPSPDGVPVARTTYNPDFAGVFNEFDRVFD